MSRFDPTQPIADLKSISFMKGITKFVQEQQEKLKTLKLVKICFMLLPLRYPVIASGEYRYRNKEQNKKEIITSIFKRQLGLPTTAFLEAFVLSNFYQNVRVAEPIRPFKQS